MSALDTQVGGEHYRAGAIQPVQFIESNKLAFLEGCVVKRVTRHDKPSGKGRQDIEKAIHELQLLLELRYDSTPQLLKGAWFRVGSRVIHKKSNTQNIGTIIHMRDSVADVKWNGDDAFYPIPVSELILLAPQPANRA